MWVCMYVCLCVHVGVWVGAYVCPCVHVYVGVYVRMCVRVCMCAYANAFVNADASASIQQAALGGTVRTNGLQGPLDLKVCASHALGILSNCALLDRRLKYVHTYNALWLGYHWIFYLHLHC